MNKKILLLLLGVLFSFFNLYSIDFTSCGQSVTSGNSYIMTDNLNASSDCVTINTLDNIYFDCNNYYINSTGGSNAFDISNSNNITIVNCDFFNFIFPFDLSFSLGGSNTFSNLRIENVSFYNTISDDINLNVGSSDIFRNFILRNIYFSAGTSSLDAGTLVSGTLEDSYFENIIDNSSSGTSLVGNVFNLTLENYSSYSLLYLDISNSTISNSYFSNLDVASPINTLEDNLFVNNTINSLSLSAVNNTFINNTFTNLSDISVTASPNNFTSNTYYNSSGSGSGLTICFFTGVCDTNSEVILFESLESLSSASSLFPFGSVLVSFIFVVGFFFFS